MPQRRPRELRIIAGEWRGRKLRFPAETSIRPTPDRVRETLFNWIGPGIRGLRALDLFAGSGALGLEALSRGAASATFVERDRGALTALRGNIAALDVGDRATVIATDVARFLAHPPPGPAWRWVFLDPPYLAGVYEATLAALPRARLTADCVIAVEHAHRAPPPDRVGFLLRTDLRRYGDTALSRYTLEAP